MNPLIILHYEILSASAPPELKIAWKTILPIGFLYSCNSFLSNFSLYRPWWYGNYLIYMVLIIKFCCQMENKNYILIYTLRTFESLPKKSWANIQKFNCCIGAPSWVKPQSFSNFYRWQKKLEISPYSEHNSKNPPFWNYFWEKNQGELNLEGLKNSSGWCWKLYTVHKIPI